MFCLWCHLLCVYSCHSRYVLDKQGALVKRESRPASDIPTVDQETEVRRAKVIGPLLFWAHGSAFSNLGIFESFGFTPLSSAEHRTVICAPSVSLAVQSLGTQAEASPRTRFPGCWAPPRFRCYLVGEAPPCGRSAHCLQQLQEAALNPLILEIPVRKMRPAFQSTLMGKSLTQCTSGCWETGLFH